MGLRRGDHSAQRLHILREKWEARKEEAAKAGRPDPVPGPIYRQFHAGTVAEFLRKDAEEHGGLQPTEIEIFLAAMGRRPVRLKEPPPPNAGATESNPVKPFADGIRRCTRGTLLYRVRPRSAVSMAAGAKNRN